MNERDFVYWLQGMLENLNDKTLDEEKLQSIKDHLKLVMIKVTPLKIDYTGMMPSILPTIIC